MPGFFYMSRSNHEIDNMTHNTAAAFIQFGKTAVFAGDRGEFLSLNVEQF